MVATKKFSRVVSLLLALVMILTLVPFQSFAAEADPAELQLQNGTVAISSDMSAEQVKKALFDALVVNPEGKDYQDYEWEYYRQGSYLLYTRMDWGSVNGFTTRAKPPAILWEETYTHPSIQDSDTSEGNYQVRLAGDTREVTLTKVYSCTVNYNYELTQGSVYVNDAQVSGTVTGVSPAADLQFTVVPKEGYKVASVTVNGQAVEAVDGVYTVLPVATTDIDVTFVEDGTFYNVTVNAGEGVTVKMDGIEVSGDVKVAEGVEYTFEYIPDDSTSVKAVKLGEDDVTSAVSFANYVGTQKLTFTGDTTLAVESVAKSAELVLTGTTEVPVAINADGSFNYDGIRANLISALIDKAQSIGVEFTAENLVFEQYALYYTAGDVPGVSSQWVSLEGTEKGPILGSYYHPVAAGSNHLRVAFTGNDQFRPTDYIEFDVTLVDVGNAVIAVKENPTVTLTETTVGNIDYSTLKQDIFDAAIDTASSLPADLTLEDLELTVPENITESGKYSVTARYPGSVNYRETTVTFDVQVNVVKCPTADIALKADTVDAVLKETAVGVYDNAALKEAVYAAAVDLDACAANGLDVSKLVFELQDVTTEGTYTAKISYPDTETHHANSVTVTVNVTVDKCPTVQFEQVADSAVLYRGYDRDSYNYDGLKEDIFNNVLKVTGVEDLQWSDATYEYKVYDLGGTIGTYQPFDLDHIWGDNSGNMYKYLRNGGTFDIKVNVPTSESYYGAQIEFKLNVSIGDSYVSEIVTNEGPFDLVLNVNRDRTYDYDGLKQAIFEAAVKEVKNVPGKVNWDYLTYSYKVGLGDNFHDFTTTSLPEDVAGIIYNYLYKGGEFTIRLAIADGNGFWGSHVDITVKVTVVDPYASDIKVKSEIAPVTLKETTVGNFDYESLKAQIFEAAIDAENSTPSNLTVDSFDYVIPEINGSGVYNVTANFKETFDNVADSVSFDIQVNVEVLPTASIVLKANAVSAVLTETEIDKFDFDTLNKTIFEGAVDTQATTPALTYKDVTITFDREINADGKYTATITYPGTSTIHGTSAKVTADIDVAFLPSVSIETQSRNLVLNKNIAGDYDYDGLKKAIFDECLRVTGVDGLSWNNFKYEYKLFNAIGTTDSWSGLYRDFEIRKPSFDLEETYKYLYKGGDFQIRVSIPDSSAYHGDSAELSINVTVEDPYYAEIALKPNYQNNYTLNYADNGEFDYDRLEKEIFDAVIDLENSPENVTFENAVITYQILDAMGTSTGIGAGDYYDFAQGTLPADAANTYRYMYKGGTFNIKVAVPGDENHRAVETVFSVNIQPFSRVPSNVVLNSGTMDYNGDLNAIKAYVYSLIDMNASKLPSDVSIDDFTFEYYARNYTAGDIPGVEHRWVPFEGMDHPTLAGSYFKPIGNGTNKIRVVFNGTDDYLASTSNEVNFTMSKASFTISLKQNYKYLDEALPKDFVQPSVSDNFEHYYIALDASASTGIIYIDSLSGLGELDFTGNIALSWWLTQILGAGVTADSVYNRDGLSRDQLVTLLSDSRMIDFLDGYNIDANAVSKMLDVINSIPESVTHFSFKMGQPTKPGTYTMFAMATNANYYTATASSVFYVKYHSTGTKLVFVQDTDGLNSFNVGKFDYSAVVTKDGVPTGTGTIHYLYTGFRSNALFYASTKEGPRQAGIYTQTAWTAWFTSPYAFPKTRTFTVSLL